MRVISHSLALTSGKVLSEWRKDQASDDTDGSVIFLELAQMSDKTLTMLMQQMREQSREGAELERFRSREGVKGSGARKA